MRKSTSALRRALAAAEAAEDHLANKLAALPTFIESAERSRMERDDALRAAITEDQAAFLAETRARPFEQLYCPSRKERLSGSGWGFRGGVAFGGRVAACTGGSLAERGPN